MFKERKQEFLDSFYRDILPYIAQGETQRKRYLFIIITIIISSIIGCIALLYWWINLGDFDANTLKGIMSYIAIFVLIGGTPSILLKDKFIRLIKKRYMNGIVSFFNGMKWLNSEDMEPSSKIKVFKQNPLFTDENITEITIDDFFTGKYNDIDYELFEVKLADVRGSGKGRHEMQIFKGITLELNLKDIVSDEILIYSKNMRLNKSGETWLPTMYFSFFVVFGIILYTRYLNNSDPVNLVFIIIGMAAYLVVAIFLTVRIKKFFNKNKFNEMNDLRINDNYCVSSKNTSEAERIAKPDLFGILQSISLAFNSKGVSLNTYREYGNTKAMVTIPTKLNAFEIGSLCTPLNKPESMSNFFNQLSSIMDLIDYFANLENTNQE